LSNASREEIRRRILLIKSSNLWLAKYEKKKKQKKNKSEKK